MPANRYVNGADPNRRLGSYRNLVEVIKATPGAPGIQPLLHDWHLLEGQAMTDDVPLFPKNDVTF